MKRLLALVGVVLVLGCSPSPSATGPVLVAAPTTSQVPTPPAMSPASPQPAPAATPTALPFRTVFQSRHFSHQADQPEVFVFRSADDVATFAKDHPGAEALPALDFKQEMGVLVLFGHQVVWNLGELVGIDDVGANLAVNTARWGPDADVDAVGDPAAYVALAPVARPVVLAPVKDRRETERTAWRGLVQGPPAVRVGTPLLLTAAGADVRWQLESGSATSAPDRTICVVTPTAPGPIRLVVTTRTETSRLLLAGVAPDVPAPLPSRRLMELDANQEIFPPSVFVINSAAAWQALWSSAAARTANTYASIAGKPFPEVPAVDFSRRSLVVLTDALYPGEDAPVLTRLAPTLDVVKPDPGRSVSHLDFYQSITLYDVPKLPEDVPVSSTCQERVSCPTPSPSGF
jgi:hypothetical protein